MLDLLLFRIVRGRPRLFIGLGIGLLCTLALTPVQSWAIRCVVGWDIGSAIFIGLSAITVYRSEDSDISADAKRQEEGEWTLFGLTLFGSIMSFVAIFLFSGAASHKHDRGGYLAFVIVTLALSWLMTNVTFAYRYAHEYYSRDRGKADPGEIERGIQFPKDDKPDYADFVYFSFVLGMTFQVSDCNVTSKKLRRLATLHGLVGFVFNTVILALSVNIAASAL